MFDMTELLKKAKESALKRTDEERRQILIDAKILTEEGIYHPDYFSEETVEASRESVKIEKMEKCNKEKNSINRKIKSSNKKNKMQSKKKRL